MLSQRQKDFAIMMLKLLVLLILIGLVLTYWSDNSDLNKKNEILKADLQKEKKQSADLVAEKKYLEEKLNKKLEMPVTQACTINDEMKKLVADSCTAKKQAQAPASVARKRAVSISRVGEEERIKQALDLARLRAEAHREVVLVNPTPSRSTVKVVQDHCIFRVDGRIVAEKFVPEGQGASQCPIWREAEREERKLKQKDLIWDKKYPS